MSIKTHLDETTVINEIRLALRHPSSSSKIWIVVEGESDYKLFAKLIHGIDIEIQQSYSGVNGLERIVTKLIEETDRIIGIRDADFMHLEGVISINPHIFLTDFHDVEMMLIACDETYFHILVEYLQIRDQTEGNKLRRLILESLTYLGGLRWMNHSENLELNFKNLSLGDSYNGKELILHIESCFSKIMERSPAKKKIVQPTEVTARIHNITDLLNLCNGHDFMKAFSLYVSTHSKKGVSYTQIESSFRVAYRFEDFMHSNLYQQLLEWAQKNSRKLFNNS